MQRDHILKVEFWPLDPNLQGQGEGVCSKIPVCRPLPEGMGGGGLQQNMRYHVAAFMIPFNLICNMTMFWKSWILNFWA